MNQLGRILSLSIIFILLAAFQVEAAASRDLRATKTASQQTTLRWTPGAGTETREYSLDGLVWTPVQSAAPSGVRLDSTAVPGNSKVIGLIDFTNYYFRIQSVDGGVTTYSNVVVAYPPNEHAHRYFAADTNMCSTCHSTHVAVGAKLLKEATLNDVCKTCHVGGTGSKYQVDFGTVTGVAGARLTALAGFFGRAVASGAGVPNPTSYHPIEARPLALAPGGDPNDLNGQWSERITCGSCHTAHSDSNYQYRLLRKVLPNMRQSTGGTPKTLTAIEVEAYAVTRADKEAAVYVSGLNNFCGGCHADYNTTEVTGRPGSVASGIFNTSYYRHAVGKPLTNYLGQPGVNLTTTLPLEGAVAVWDGSVRQGDGSVSCITCHKSHGVSTTGNFVLLRMSNRGVCQDCHTK